MIALMVCRSGDEPLGPDCRAGFQCAVCGQHLQVTPKGLERIKTESDLSLLCCACGLEYAELATQFGLLDHVESHPEALAQLERGNKTAMADWMRKYFAERSKA
jgi:hypothetical protein